MTQVYKDPSTGQEHEFPDDATPQEIDMATRGSSSHPQQNEKVNTFLGEMNRPNNTREMINNPKMIDEMIRAFGTGSGIGQQGLYNVPKLSESLGNIPQIKNAANALMEKFPQMAPRLMSVLKSSENPFTGALIGGANTPDNTLLGMAVGGTAGAIPGLGKKAFNAIRPSNLFRGQQTPEQLQNSLSVTAGTETPLGDVLQSPFLKHAYENVVAKVPFSGANESMQRTGQHIVQKGNDLMRDLLGNHSPANVEGELSDTLQKANKFHINQKVQLYNEPDKISKEIGMKLNLPTFSNIAKESVAAIEDTNILKTEPEFKKLLNKLQNYQNPDKQINKGFDYATGKPIIENKPPTLKEANILSGHLNDLAEKYSASGNPADRNSANVFRRLSKALKADIKNSINETGNEDLISSFDKAEKNYAQNYSPFLEKEIYKFANGKVDPDMIVQAFIKTGKSTDRSNLLEKFTSKLPESKRKLLGYAFLKRAYNANGELDPLAFKQLLSNKNLGPRQFDLLFPGKLGKQLRDYSALIEKNPEAFQVMKNPKTGARVSDLITGGAMVFNPIATGAGILSSRALNKLMTSPKVREKLVNKMLEK